MASGLLAAFVLSGCALPERAPEPVPGLEKFEPETLPSSWKWATGSQPYRDAGGHITSYTREFTTVSDESLIVTLCIDSSDPVDEFACDFNVSLRSALTLPREGLPASGGWGYLICASENCEDDDLKRLAEEWSIHIQQQSSNAVD